MVLRDTHLLLAYCLLTRVLWRRMQLQVEIKLKEKDFWYFYLIGRPCDGAVNSNLSHPPLIMYVYCNFILVRVFPTILLAQ